MVVPALDWPRSVGDYAIVGDCRSAALISRRGSVDWLCWPHFSSEAVFAGLLDPLSGGRFALAPTASYSSSRSYAGHTNVLRTRHETATGEIVVTDCMTVCSEASKRKRLLPDHELLRVIECTRGHVELGLHYEPRAQSGRTAFRLRARGPRRVAGHSHGGLLLLDASFPLRAERARATATVAMRAGDVHTVTLVHAASSPAVMPGLGDLARARLEETVSWWREWVARCSYDGPHREHVVRSMLTLKLLCFAPSGAVVAAPTTSLPEHLGGERNWDYRYCWLRDAAVVVSRLLDLGYSREAGAYVQWLLHTTQRTMPRLRVCYDVYGKQQMPERELPWLSGFALSRPVRVGNAASAQFQLDTYGEVVAAVAEYVGHGGELDPASRRLLRGLGDEICHRWREPDEGIWEMRTGRAHHTHSKLMCWVGLDRLLRLHEQGLLSVPVAEYTRERELIATAITTHGFDPERNTWIGTFGAAWADASLLMLAHHGFVDQRDPRAIATRRWIERELAKGHLVARYRRDDGLIGVEGAFGLCSFWLVAALAEQGELERAERHLEALLGCCNDVGLFAEQFAWEDGAPLGNFPQGYSHVGAIHAILTIERARGAGRSHPASASGEEPV